MSKAVKTKRRILVLDGHPDGREERFVHALAAAYVDGAVEAGHEVRLLRLAEIEFPWLESSDEFSKGEPPAAIAAAQADIAWCDHLVIVYPLWLGSMPALLKAFFEQLLRPGFTVKPKTAGKRPKKSLAGKSARIVVTMGMPALFFKLYYRAHSLKTLERNILSFVGFGPIRASVIGNVEGLSARKRQARLVALRKLAATAK